MQCQGSLYLGEFMKALLGEVLKGIKLRERGKLYRQRRLTSFLFNTSFWRNDERNIIV